MTDSKIMSLILGASILCFSALIGVAKLQAADIPVAEAKWYIPVAFDFIDGKFSTMVQGPVPVQGQKSCIEGIQKVLTDMLNQGLIQENEEVIGGCLPIPEPRNKPQTHQVGALQYE